MCPLFLVVFQCHAFSFCESLDSAAADGVGAAVGDVGVGVGCAGAAVGGGPVCEGLCLIIVCSLPLDIGARVGLVVIIGHG